MTNGGFIAVVITAYSAIYSSRAAGYHLCEKNVVIKAGKPCRKHAGLLMCLLLSDVTSR